MCYREQGKAGSQNMPLVLVDSPGVGTHCELWLLKSWLPGSGEEGSRSEVPSTAVAPVAMADFSTVCWLVLLEVMMLTSARFSMAKTAGVDSRSFSQVLSRFRGNAITFPFYYR